MLPLVVIVGPTAVGKSEIAVEVALHLGGEVVSADSVQLYKYFDIGSAKLPPSEQKGVPHHLLDILEPDQEFSVAQYQVLARKKIAEICQNRRLPLLVGGTGLYVQAVIDPYHFPEMSQVQELRQQHLEIWDNGGAKQLYARLQEIDPETARRLHPNDFRRISRALEVYQLTGHTISSFQKQQGAERLYHLAMIGLTRSRPELYRRIELRVEQMFRSGLVEETRKILEMGYPPELKPFQSLGYKQAVGFLRGEYDLKKAIELTKQATRNYAKRQLTWFRRDGRINWFDLDLEEDRQATISKIISCICRNISFSVE